MEEALRSAGGAVNPTKTELHTPEITSGHLKQLATFLGAELVGIARLREPAQPDEGDPYPFAIVCAVKADYDPRKAKGVGGSNSGDLFRYDPLLQQYVYNLNASTLQSNSIYAIRTVLDDGTKHDVLISIK